MCLYVLESVEDSTLQSIPKFVLLEKVFKEIPGDHETLSIVHHVGLHVDFSSMKSSLGF